MKKINLRLNQLIEATEDVIDQQTGRTLRIAPFSKLKTASLPMGDMFDLKRLNDVLQREVKAINEQRFELIKKYGAIEKDAAGIEIPNQWRVEMRHLAEYQADISELLTHSIEIEVKPIGAEMLTRHSAKLEAVGINTEDLIALDWLIDKDEKRE